MQIMLISIDSIFYQLMYATKTFKYETHLLNFSFSAVYMTSSKVLLGLLFFNCFFICIFIFKAAFEAIPHSLVEAARIDGVPDWQIMFRLIMPLTKPAIATNVILSFIWSWNSFLWPLVVVRDVDMQTLPLGLSRFMSVVEDTTGALYAFCVMVLVPGLLIFLLAQKEFIKGLTSGATKG